MLLFFLRLGQKFGWSLITITSQAVSPVPARFRIVGSLVMTGRINPVASGNGHYYEHNASMGSYVKWHICLEQTDSSRVELVGSE